MVRPGRSRRALVLVGLLGAVGYLVTRLALGSSPLGLVTKALPMLALLVAVRGARPDRYSRRIAAGLVASLAGDLLLEVSPNLFLFGLLAFLVAHIFYIVAFVGRIRAPRLLLALPFAAWTALAFITLSPGLGSMRAPVALYTVVIAVMGWRASALLGGERPRSAEPWFAAGGAVLFMLSDTLLAFNRFYAPIEGAGLGIMLLYWGGQLGIAASAWSEARPRRLDGRRA